MCGAAAHAPPSVGFTLRLGEIELESDQDVSVFVVALEELASIEELPR